MGLRSLVIAMAVGSVWASAGFALAQSSGYVSFAAPNGEACAVACGGDPLCASWVYGARARSYGQQSGGGMCTFTTSSTPVSAQGTVSGLPRRSGANAPTAPMGRGVPAPVMSAPVMRAPQTSATFAQPNTQGTTGWEVRPAPWLSRPSAPNATPIPVAPQNYPRMPEVPQPMVAPSPAHMPANVPRIDYDPAPRGGNNPPVILTPQAPHVRAPQSPPQLAPQQMIPAPFVRANAAPAPVPLPPVRAPLSVPPPPPGTQEFPEGTVLVPDVPAAQPASATRQMRTRPASGTPRTNTNGPVVGERVTDVDGPPQTAPVTIAPPRRASAPRLLPKTRAPTLPDPATAPTSAPPTQGQNSNLAAPPRQAPQMRPAGAATAARRPPVRDPFNPESFRGPDGMIDAAEMRRAQLEAARTQGAPAYSVQREWEAVEAERQRAEAAGEVRADPLAGTVPVPPPPETPAQRRARIAEEAEIEAAARRESGEAEEEEAAPAAQPASSSSRGARGTPRLRPAPRAPAQALDREPRLSGGPG